MENLKFFIEINLFLIVFYAFYFLMLKNETFHWGNRIYLILSVLISVSIPFFENIKSIFIATQTPILNNYTLNEIVVMPVKNISQSYDYHWITNIYWVIAGILFLLKIAQIIKLKLSLKNGNISNPAFSFLGKSYIDKSIKNLEAISTHENAHNKLWHFADLIIFELLSIVFWINPIVYLYKSSIRMIHEFMADAYTCKHQATTTEYINIFCLIQNLMFQKIEYLNNLFLINQPLNLE